MTVNTIENLTGLDFFPSLPNSSENRVEASVATSNWYMKLVISEDE